MKLSKWLLVGVCSVGLACSAGVFAKDKSEANKYPNATRHDPKVNMSSGDQKLLNKAADLVNDGKSAEAQPLIEKVLGNNGSSPYAQAFAHQLMAQVYYDQEKGAQSIEEYKKAIAFDALPNDAQFSLIYGLAQTQVQEEKYQDALATLADWEKQTGSQSADELALKANAYYRVDQFQPAIDTMKKAMSMTDKPNDSWSQILMASYFELNQFDQAAELVK
jgi:tetratricopeptide (TPR) repeat protein